MNKLFRFIAVLSLALIAYPKISPAVVYVNLAATGGNNGTTWTDAYTNIYDALRLGAGVSAREFWVARGTYVPSFAAATTQTMPLTTNDVVFGGFFGNETVRSQRNWVTNEVVISGDINGDGVANDTQRGLIKTWGQNANLVYLNGLTFKLGRNNSSVLIFGGVLTTDTVGPGFAVENCVFSNNLSAFVGGVAVLAAGSYNSFSNCVFYNNTCTNGHFGGAIYHRRGQGGIGCHIVNSTFASNVASIAGVPAVDGHDVFKHVSMAMTIRNSILWSSTNATSYNVSNERPTLIHCNVTNYIGIVNGFQGSFGFVGFSNIMSNPLFVDATTGNLQLQSGSPSIDTATNTPNSGITVTNDILGVLRPQGTLNDMGAYEKVSSSQYNITLVGDPVGGDPFSVNINAGGSFNVTTPHGPTLYDGGAVTLTATTPKTIVAGVSRYDLKRWQDTSGGIFTANPLAITLGVATNFTLYYFTEYKMDVSTNPVSGAGTAVTSEGDGWATNGASISWTATPGSGWTFSNWTEGGGGSSLGSANPITRTVDAQTNLTANFTCSGSSITVQSAPPGRTLNVEGVDDSSGATYCYVAATVKNFYTISNQVVNAGENMRFVNWTYGVTTDAATNILYTVPGSDQTVTANFTPYYKLTLAASGSGTIATNLFSGDGFYATGTVVQVTATPASGFGFAYWSGATVSSNNPLNVTMSTAKSLTANFVPVRMVKSGASGANNGTSWTDAYVSLAQGMAVEGAMEFWVASGTYTNFAAATPMSSQDGDSIYGGFAGTETSRGARDWSVNTAIISGDLNGNSTADDMSVPLLRNELAGTLSVEGLTFKYAQFASSYGGAIYCNGTALNVRNCRFQDNTANSGGAIGGRNGTWTIENSLFHDNNTSAFDGGAIRSHSFVVANIVNCTFMNNSSFTGTGRDVYKHTSTTMDIKNSIMWSPAAFVSGGGVGAITISYTDVNGGFAGTGNINSDPTFYSSASDDYHLITGSPALDTATSSGAPARDLDNEARPQDDDGDTVAEFDMGAFEGGVTTTTSTSTSSSSTSSTSTSTSTSSSSTSSSTSSTTSSTSSTASGSLPATSVIRFK